MATDKKAKKSPKKQSDKSLKNYKLGGFKFSLTQMALVAVIFAAIGGYFIWRAFAIPPDPPSVNLFINEPGQPKSLTLTAGQGTMLGWQVYLASSCQASGSWSGLKSHADGSYYYESTGALSAGTYTYTLTCYNVNGSTTDSVTVYVNNPPPPPPTVSITANGSHSTTVTSGEAVNLNWTSTNAGGCSSSWTGGGIAANGGDTVFPTASTTTNKYYTVQCQNSSGNGSDTATVTVKPPPPPPPAPSVSISANPGTIDKGSSSTLSWSSNNASSCSASGAWSGSKSTVGSQGVSPSTSSTYVISCSGSGGSASASTTVSVRNTPPPPAAPAVKLVSAPSSIAYNGTTYLQWSSSNASSCSASWTGSHGTSGTQQVGPLTSNQTYTISCSGAGGSASASASVTVAKPPAGCPPNCPKPAAPAAPKTALEAPAPTSSITPSSSSEEETGFSSDNFSSGNLETKKTKHRNWLRDLLLGGLLGLLTGQAKGAK